MVFTIPVEKTKALISLAVTVKLVCAFVFAWAKIWFSHIMADILVVWEHLSCLNVILEDDFGVK